MTERVPVLAGWFRDGAEPVLLGSRCLRCDAISFPPGRTLCADPTCQGGEFETAELSRRGRVWSYTDTQYQPPPPYVPQHDPYRPFAIAAVELPEGLVILGQLAQGCTVADVRVGSEVELIVQTLYREGDTDRTIWRWQPLGGGTAEGSSS